MSTVVTGATATKPGHGGTHNTAAATTGEGGHRAISGMFIYFIHFAAKIAEVSQLAIKREAGGCCSGPASAALVSYRRRQQQPRESSGISQVARPRSGLSRGAGARLCGRGASELRRAGPRYHNMFLLGRGLMTATAALCKHGVGDTGDTCYLLEQSDTPCSVIVLHQLSSSSI